MNIVLHYIRLIYLVILFSLGCLTISSAVTYALFTVFGWYTLVFLLIAVWIAYMLSKGLINFTLGA